MTASSRGEVKSRFRVQSPNDSHSVRIGDLLLPGTGGMTGAMKNRKNNVLPFPQAVEQSGISTIIAQIGGQRFAIHIQTEDLPPAEPPLVMRKRKAKAASKIVK
jgi:hypothetical protein